MTLDDHYLAKALDSLNRKVIVVSSDFIILASNRYDDNVSKREIIGKTCYEVLKNRESPCNNCPVQEVIHTRKPAIRHIHCDEDGFGAGSCIYSYPLESEKLKNALVILDFDLSAINDLDEKRQSSNSFFRNLIHSAADAVIAADKKGQILIFNEAASELTGYTVSEALTGLNIRRLYPKGDAQKLMELMRSDQYGIRGKLKGYVQEACHKDGDIFPISLSSSIVYEGEKEVATIGFFHDLRKAIKMKEELKKTQTQLLQAEKMASLGKLAAGVAHQLNNPLGGITLFAQIMLEDYDLPENAVSDLQRILRDAKRCSTIVKELLEFARQTKYKMLPQNINEAITRTLFLLQNQSIFQNIEIEYTPFEELPLIQADIQQLYHMFMNIILNAADAMQNSGKLTITTQVEPDNKNIVILISDTGPGIPEDILPHIFEPFFTTKEEGKGTGLGLSMVYGIVEQHGGLISAESSNESGTKFSILLPIRPDNS